MLVVLFAALNVAAKLIGSDRLIHNALDAERALNAEGEYPRQWVDVPLLQKDNFTDAIMVSTSVCRLPGNVVDNAFANPYYGYSPDDGSNAQGVIDGLTGKSDEIWMYGRYWHGYNVVLTPLLSIADFSTVRVINMVALYLLAILAPMMIWKRLGRSVAAFFVISLLGVAFPIVPMSMQFSTCFYILFIAIILMLSIDKRWFDLSNSAVFFFITGAVTSYFDFLTTPLITLGFPAAILLLYCDALPGYKRLLVVSLMWGAGYAGLWASKWMLSALLTDYDIFESAVESIKMRSSAIVQTGDPLKATHATLLIALGASTALLGLFALWLRTKYRKGVYNSKYFPFFIIGCYPVVWMLALQNHSFIHFWFVWRILSVSIFCFLTFCYYSFYRKTSCLTSQS